MVFCALVFSAGCLPPVDLHIFLIGYQKLDTSIEIERDSAYILFKHRFLLSVGVGPAGEQEDEEAFLEGITSPSGPLLPQLALKVKLHTADHWSPALLIKPGQHQAGQQQQAVQGCLLDCMLQWLIW